MSRGLSFVAGCAIAIVLAAAQANAEQTIKVGLSLPQTMKGAEPVNGMYELFKAEVEKNSGGKLKVDISYGGALGKPDDRLAQMRRGIIQMSDGSDGNYATIYRDIQVFSMPYLFPSEEVAWKILDGPIGTRMAEDLRKKTGIRSLGWWESGGFKHYSANKEIRTPADMKGLKMRVMAPIFGIPVKTMGASPVPIAFNELYTSLKTGVVDGQDNAVWVFNIVKLYEVQKFLILDGHIYAFGPMGINDKFFQSLSPELQKVVLDAGKAAIAFNRKTSRAMEAKEIEFAKSKGVTVVSFSAEQKAKFAETVRPEAVKWLKANMDTPGLVDEVIAAVKEASK